VVPADGGDGGGQRVDDVGRVQPPPSPASTTATSTPTRAKCANAITVRISKNVSPMPWANVTDRTSSAVATSAARLIGTPATVIRSPSSTRCGEV
jgi:hypothetical protein